jgi:3-isopropylmalate dehydrogenase
MNANIAVIPGDGIGPEVTNEAVKVLNSVAKAFGHNFSYKTLLAGGCAIDACGTALPEETLNVCKASDAVLLGAVGGMKWDTLPGDKRPETALLALRKELGLYANLRPAMLFPALAESCPLRPELVAGGLDILVVRELTGGIYFGKKDTYTKDGIRSAYDIEEYSETEIARIAKTAFEMARLRRGQVTSVDKANVLDSSRLWRAVVTEISADYPDIKLNHLYVDNTAMQLVRAPKQFDVILTSNIFGDILSDEASQIAGSIGMLPSASLNKSDFGMYEPIHGSAPDIAGKNIANPMAAILSAAMMLRYTFKLTKEAETIEKAVTDVLNEGYRTADLSNGADNERVLGTAEAGAVIAERVC